MQTIFYSEHYSFYSESYLNLLDMSKTHYSVTVVLTLSIKTGKCNFFFVVQMETVEACHMNNINKRH